MIGPRFVIKMAWREGRAGRRKLALLTGAVAAGVAALVAINSFVANLRDSVATQAQSLLGADLSMSSRTPFSNQAKTLLDSLAQTDQVAQVASFAAMAYVPTTTGARLVQVRALDPGYPYYGSIVTEPAGQWERLAQGGLVLVDPTLLPVLNTQVGDTLVLGDARLLIAGTVLNFPGSIGVAAAFGPRVYIGTRDLAATGLLEFGSRVEYDAYAKLADPTEVGELTRRYRPPLRAERVSIRTVDDRRDNMTEVLERLGNYLGLVALVALLLGGLGVASAVHVFIRQKLDTIAVLRCLGATAPEVFLIYLLQALAMGVVGSLLGAGLGIAIQQGMPRLVSGLIPVDVQIVLSWRAIIMGVALGAWVSMVFAVLPLLAIRHVSPLVTLRRDFEPSKVRWDIPRIIAGLVLAVSVVFLATIQVRNLGDGIAFAAGIGVVLLVLWLASTALIRGVRKWFPTRWPYVVRQGLANLYRPANQTVTVVLSLGFGAFLLSTLYLVQHNLLREFRIEGDVGRPNLMFFEIQPDQQRGVMEILTANGVEGSSPVPIVPMRIRSIKGVPVRVEIRGRDSLNLDSLTNQAGENVEAPRGWGVRREYRSTYRDSLTTSETLIAGRLWNTAEIAPNQPIPISIEVSIAEELGVTIDDEMEWEIQGAVIPTKIWNIREVDWGRFDTNFYVVFASGALERAPQMLVTLVRETDPAKRGAIQRSIVERYPNVSAIDLSQVQELIEGIIGKAVLAIRFMALFSLATGAIVLIGAVATSRLQRIREGILLKTLGASRRQVLKVIVVEYLALGFLSIAVSIVLASAAGWALAKWVFEQPYALPLIPLSGLSVLLAGLTLIAGLWNSAEILNRPPLEVLRAE